MGERKVGLRGDRAPKVLQRRGGIAPGRYSRTWTSRGSGWVRRNTGNPQRSSPKEVVFISAASDHLYIFDKVDGTLLRAIALGGGGFGNPVTYLAGGRQQVSIATSQSDGSGAKILTFSLPRQDAVMGTSSLALLALAAPGQTLR